MATLLLADIAAAVPLAAVPTAASVPNTIESALLLFAWLPMAMPFSPVFFATEPMATPLAPVEVMA